MYDAVFFLVMVSLSGVILLPVLHPKIAVETSIEKHREELVGDTLQTFLVTRSDLFEYRFGGNLIDDVAGRIGIQNTSDGLYGSVTHWLLSHEQRHKTFASLFSEYLGCQFRVPFSGVGIHQMNIFMGDFEQQLRNETEKYLNPIFKDKYHYNLTASWHPIRGIPFGGDFYVGESPPSQDCYVAHQFFMMPYTPVFLFGNHTIILTKHWVKHQLFDEELGFGRSSIPSIANITLILQKYSNHQYPFETRQNATRATKENLSTLVYGFLVKGITNETNTTVFPGIVPITLAYGFEKLKNMTGQFLDKKLNESFGASIRSIDRLFSGLNASIRNSLSDAMLEILNKTLGSLLNGTFDSFDEVIDACQNAIKERIVSLLRQTIDAVLQIFTDRLFDVIDTIIDFSEMLLDLLFDSISLNRGEMKLTIWVVRE
jgi:hypothetical protein